MDSLVHRRNVTCCSLFYLNYNGFCCSKIQKLVSENHVSLHRTQLSRRAQPFVDGWLVNRALPAKQISVFSPFIRMWNSLAADMFPFNLMSTNFPPSLDVFS